MPEELLQTAREAARAGAELLRGMWGQGLEVSQKGRFDFVTQADRRSEAAILEIIRSRHPDHAILAEESAGDWQEAAASPDVLWIVDPLDGTTNYIHGFPMVGVSVAAWRRGRPLVGVIIDLARDEEFHALAGGGAWSGERRLRVSPVEDPARSLLLTGFPFREKDRLDEFLALFRELFNRVSGVRRAGAACLDLAYLAAGRAEGFWETGLSPWDVAAGVLLIEEAGGVVSDFAGGDGYLWNRQLVAGNPATHPWLREACLRHMGPPA